MLIYINGYMDENGTATKLYSAGLTPGKLSGYGYISGNTLAILSAGVNKNPFGFAASILTMLGHVLLARGAGDNKTHSQIIQGIYISASFCYKLGGLIDNKTLGIRVSGNLYSLALGAFEGKVAEGGFIDKLVERRAVVAGGISLVGRIPLLETSYTEVAKRPSPASWAWFIAVVIWTGSDILYMASKTKQDGQLNPLRESQQR